MNAHRAAVISAYILISILVTPCVMRGLAAMQRVDGNGDRRPRCGGVRRFLVPLLLSGLGVAMPLQAAVTQTPGNVVTPGVQVEYLVSTIVPSGASTQITVQEGGTDITAQMSSTDCSFDGVLYCSGNIPGSSRLDWLPAAGVHNLTITVNCFDVDGIACGTDQFSVTTAVGTESLDLQVSSTPTTYARVGDVITYTYKITNTGDLDLGLVALSDNRLGTISACDVATLAASASVSCSQTYTVTQADITSGSLSNNAQATATSLYSGMQVLAGGSTLSSVGSTDLVLIPALNPNQSALAGALDNVCSTSVNTTVQTMCTQINSLTTNQIRDALQQLVPDQVAAQGTSAVETSFTQLANIRWRLLALHNNGDSKMLALNGLMLAVNGQSIPVGLLADATTDESNIANSGRLGGFVKGRIQLGDSSATSNAAGYDFSTKGVTMGVDYRLSDQLVLGGALGYANTNNDYKSSRGDMSADGTTLSFYGSYYAPRDIYLDWIASYGSNKYSSTRNITYSGINTQAQGDPNGSQLGTSLSVGTDVSRGAWVFTPYLRAEYVEAKVDAYDESGGSGLALSYDQQTVHSFTTAAAARVAKTVSTRSGVFTPSAHLEWEHQYRNDQRMITARFVEDPSAPFQTATDSPDRNYFNLGLSMAATWPAGRSGFISYEMVLGQNNIRSYTFDFGVRQEF